MDCSTCNDLTVAFDTVRREYAEARSSACFRVSKRHAAKKNVDMERARFALEEHRRACVTPVLEAVLPATADAPKSLKQQAA